MLLISNLLTCPHSMALARMLLLVSLIFWKLYQVAPHHEALGLSEPPGELGKMQIPVLDSVGVH